MSPLESIRLETDSIDAAIREAEETPAGGHVVEVTVIRAGTSNNGNHYPDESLRQAVGLFEGARAFADHQAPRDAGQPRSVRDLVGHYRRPRFEPAPAGGRVRADLHLLPGQDWLWGIIQEAQSHPDLCGLSIDAKGEVKTAQVGGRAVRLVESIRKVNSIDIVSRPAAGGTLDRIIAGEAEDDADDLTSPMVRRDHAIAVAEAGTDAATPGISDERPRMEDSDPGADPFDADERKRFATVVRHLPDGAVEYKFPIPPRGHPAAVGHARAALARIDQSDLTAQEKAAVRARADAVLGTAEHHAKESSMGSPAATPLVRDPAAPSTSQPKAAAAVIQTTPAPLIEGDARAAEPAGLAAELRNLREERDSAARELAQIRHALAPAPPAPADPNATAVQLLEQIRHDRDLERCGRVLDAGLRESRLPEAIQGRLRRRYDGRVFAESRLTEDIQEEREVLGALSQSGLVTGHGYEKPMQMGMSEYEQLQAAFDKLFDVVESDQARSVPAFGGIRDAFRISTGVDIAAIGGVDRPLQEAYATGLRNYVSAKMAAGQLTEAEYLLREADVTTSTFSYLLGTSMNKRLLKDYQAWPSEWQKFTNVVAVKDFKLQDRIRLGAFGSLSTVSEDAAYTTLTLADTHATYTPTKRGNLVQISRETIINDDLYAIKQIPQKLAISAAFTLAEFVYGLLDPNGANIYDAHKLFDTTNHLNTGIATANLGTANSGTAFSSAAMQTAVIAMRKQTNAAGKPIGLKPRFLLVPPDLEFTAMTILKSAGLPGGANNDINPMMGYAEPIVAPQLNSFPVEGATTTFACVVADPRVVDTVEVGFIGGQVNPVLFIQDQPLYGLNFTQDVISYKVRHEYGGAVVDYRGFYLINN
ncbi:MAG TPA: Mu-like prophage major head subunit gpT family protein [Chloroflexota bacterium]|nr:Mu-like prophage major head subunit gpT family protein [Chloroflexota bacterium]